MTNLTVLTVSIEVRPQYGENDIVLIGVFDNPEMIQKAKNQYKLKEEHKYCRYNFNEKVVELNIINQQ